MKTILSCLVAFMFITVGLLAEDDINRFEAYPFGNLDPQAAEEIVKAIVGEDGTVVIDTKNQRLLVIATDGEHGRIAEVMTQVDVVPMNVRIDVQFRGQSSGTETDIGVSGQGGVIIKDGKTHSRIELQPRLKHQTTESSSDVTQTLLTGSGREAKLHVGEEVPYSEWFVDYGLRWGVIQERVSWQKVGAVLVVTPTVIGEGPLINVRITPELSGLVDGDPYRVRFARAATDVTVRDGETIQIGGLAKDNDFYSRFLIGFDRSRQTQNMDILLTPHIVKPMGP